VEIENGAILTAPSGDFNKVFQVTQKNGGVVEYSTSGRVSDERIARQ
jgi:hypothetical protein